MIPSLFLALLMIPVALFSAQDVLDQDPRWEHGNFENGNRYHYVICDNGIINRCYEADMVFEGTTLSVSIRDLAGIYINHIQDDITGEFENDMFYISYPGGEVTSQDRKFEYSINHRFELSSSYNTPEIRDYARSIERTVLLLGGDIKIGDGRILEYDPILEVGKIWNIPSDDMQVLVKKTEDGYTYDYLHFPEITHRIEYSTTRPVLDVTIAKDVPLPLQGTVMAESDVLYDDPYIADRFWFRLLDTNHPGFERMNFDGMDVIEPEMPVSEEPENPDIMPEPDTMPEDHNSGAEIDPEWRVESEEYNDGNLLDEISKYIEDPTKLQELLQIIIDSVGQAPLENIQSDPERYLELKTDRNSYLRGDIIEFSGRTSYNADSGIITIIADEQELDIIPVTFERDSTFFISKSTADWDAIGLLHAEINVQGKRASVVFDYNIDMEIPSVEIPHVVENRDSTIEVFADRILVYMAPGNATVLHVDISYEIADRDAILDVFVDEVSTIYTEEFTDEYRTISIDIPSVALFAEILFYDKPKGISCMGFAQCIESVITKVIDGDTIKIQGGQNIRFALASAPETDEEFGAEATSHIESICPPGSIVLVDEDDLQTSGSYGRLVGVVYCNGINLNESLLESGYGYVITRFCGTSEFGGNDWAVRYGC